MAITAATPKKYGRLLARVLPKVIETHEELEHFADEMEKLDRLERDLTPEEAQLRGLLAELIREYDEKVELPKIEPYKVVLHLMEHGGLSRADLMPIFGSRSVAADVLNGKRELSKAHIRGLAEFFKLSPAAFF